MDVANFDCVFINDQIGQHDRAMQLVNRQLQAPTALSEPVRTFLNQTLTELESHGEALQTLLEQDLCPEMQHTATL